MADVGTIGLVHNGKTHIHVKPTTLFVGHKWGEFAPTRKIHYPKKKDGRTEKKAKK